jgi:hypothetical protein
MGLDLHVERGNSGLGVLVLELDQEWDGQKGHGNQQQATLRGGGWNF